MPQRLLAALLFLPQPVVEPGLLTHCFIQTMDAAKQNVKRTDYHHSAGGQIINRLSDRGPLYPRQMARYHAQKAPQNSQACKQKALPQRQHHEQAADIVPEIRAVQPPAQAGQQSIGKKLQHQQYL
ncbi:hypothetical protein SDC9_132711 [bioreactor metagenome]|uniref:Uncharacterized protein n=1 Tax=bioreactor metagenome TaxID=1076179 RepID=A0A645D7Y1_9ZZZZ